jgi:hypothetical protein
MVGDTAICDALVACRKLLEQTRRDLRQTQTEAGAIGDALIGAPCRQQLDFVVWLEGPVHRPSPLSRFTISRSFVELVHRRMA